MTEKWISDTKKMVDSGYKGFFARRGLKAPWVPKDVLLPLPSVDMPSGASIYSPDKHKRKGVPSNG